MTRKTARSSDYQRGYQVGYAAAMKRRLVKGKPLGRPQRRAPVYRCAGCGVDSSSEDGDTCPKCGSAQITGEVGTPALADVARTLPASQEEK